MWALSAVNRQCTRHGLKSIDTAHGDFSPCQPCARTSVRRLLYNKKRPLRPGRILGRSRRCAPWYHPPFHQYPPQQANTGERIAITAIRLLLLPHYRWATLAPTHPVSVSRFGFSVAGSGVNFSVLHACRGSQSPATAPCLALVRLLSPSSPIPRLRLFCLLRLPRDVVAPLQRVSHFRRWLH